MCFSIPPSSGHGDKYAADAKDKKEKHQEKRPVNLVLDLKNSEIKYIFLTCPAAAALSLQQCGNSLTPDLYLDCSEPTEKEILVSAL